MATTNQSQLRWRKSSFSGSSGNECIEVATIRAGAAVRDSKNPHGGALLLTGSAWDQFREVAKGRDGGAL
ncbi:MAG: DUF397 domain-containing protein [Actinophytocola sp.]|uniref:DUF397 domain-containing protein n=1 Tax=Actinophytocola sp. TaxID=1872138 RepID=UPI003C73E1B5